MSKVRRNLPSPYYFVNYVETVEFGHRLFPLVYLSNGELSYSLLAYLKENYKVGIGKEGSTQFNVLFRVVGELNYFFDSADDEQRRRWEETPRLLVVDYFSNKLYGFDSCCNESQKALFSKRVMLNNLIPLISRFNEYEQWYSTYSNADALDSEKVIHSLLRRYTSFKTRAKFDLFAHLADFSMPTHKTKLSLSYEFETLTSMNKKYTFFPPERIVELITSSMDINQEAMYLLCAFTCLRASEALQILISDIVSTDDEILPVILVNHPNSGFTYDHEHRAFISRRKYFEDRKSSKKLVEDMKSEDLHFMNNIRPRTLAAGSKYRLGWKGMLTEGVSNDKPFGTTLIWTNDHAKVRFFQIYKRLVTQKRVCDHPFLICDGSGYPLSFSTYQKRLERQSLKILGVILRSHSMRHFSGYYIANVLEVSIEVARIYLRHCSITSTQVYYHVSNATVAKQMTGLEQKNRFKIDTRGLLKNGR